MASDTFYKYCIVPLCKSTTKSTPEKIFICIPKGEVVRKKWCRAMNRCEKSNRPLSAISTRHVCEDHFDMHNDMENFQRFKLQNVPLRVKKGVLPHRFDCQKEKQPKLRQSMAVRKREIIELLQPSLNLPSTSTEAMDVDVDNTIMKSVQTQTDVTSLSSKASQTQQGKSKHVGITTNIKVSSENRATSPMKMLPSHMTVNDLDSRSIDTEEQSFNSDSDYTPEESTDSDYNPVDEEKEFFQSLMRKASLTAIEKAPRLFLGILPELYFTISVLSDTTKLHQRDIMISLKKIRCGDSYERLGIDFGMSASNVCLIFKKTTQLLARAFQELVYFPSGKQIQAKLPISFRENFSRVTSIIDCLEIEIEKPSNPLHQALTWSSYKGCNTLKYLLACTPDGFITFCSEGYGGRATDTEIVKDCGILDAFRPGMIMADRGFKNISFELESRNCKLVRPPSVSANTPSSKEEVKMSRSISALRIHVERVIGRLREFNMLLPHSCVDNHLLQSFDCIIIIACGLINLQSKIIKY